MSAMDLREPAITEAQRKLALKIARGFSRRLPRNVLVEDLEQAALLGLWDGLQKSAGRDYTEEHLSFYLTTRIRGAILDELRAEDWLHRRTRKDPATSHLVVVHGEDTLAFGSWEQTLAAPQADIDERLDAERKVEFGLQALREDPRGRRSLTIVREHHYRGRSQQSIARELGVSAPRVHYLHERALCTMRAALTEEEHESRGSHRRAGTAAPEARAPGAVAVGIRSGGLARQTAPAAHRSVPRSIGSAELGRGAPQELRGARPAPRLAGAAAAPGGGLAVTTAPATEPVPSVLPEGGIDLAAELERYRTWLTDQALVRTNHDVQAAAKLLGYSDGSALYTFLRRRRAAGGAFRRGGASKHMGAPPPQKLPQAAPIVIRSPEEADQLLGAPNAASEFLRRQGSASIIPAAAAPADLRTERQIARLMERIDWKRVEQWRTEGVNEWLIAKRLAGGLDTHRFTVEKALARRREQEQKP